VVQVYFEQMDFDCLPLPVLKLKSLKRLKLCDCASLRSLPPEPASLKELEELSLNYCSGLERLPDLSQITALKDVPTIGASAAAQAWQRGDMAAFPAQLSAEQAAVLALRVTPGVTNFQGDKPVTASEVQLKDKDFEAVDSREALGHPLSLLSQGLPC